MTSIELQDLEVTLDQVLQRVRAGEDFLLTDGGEVVAELRSPRLPAGLYRLALRGSLILGKPNRPEIYPSLPCLGLPEGTAARLLDEERADRRD